MIQTPPLSEGCIAGVMRRYIITMLAEKGVHVQEKILTKEELINADEVFISNAVKRIKWVDSFGNKHYKSNTISSLCAYLFNNK